MLNKTEKQFADSFDLLQLITVPARENLGEDSFYCGHAKDSAIVSVFDGCGGLGARKYDSVNNHTGAYIASRVVSGAVRDWYHDNSEMSWKQADIFSDSVGKYIKNAYLVCKQYIVERSNIRGSMVRPFPTTMALAYAEIDESDILLHVVWAGDSRVYLLDDNGLAQLTIDDTDVPDALENLVSDGVMTNVISSDGNFKLNYKSIRLDHPGIVFAATDGCFGYIPSPMEFEYEVLCALTNNNNPIDCKETLKTVLSEYTGDDMALGLMSFGYGDYSRMKDVFAVRRSRLESEYIDVIAHDRTDELVKSLWNRYRTGYERYL